MAYNEGRQARRDGKARNANPYSPTSPAPFAMWDEGWRDSDAMLRALGGADR